MQTTGFHQLLQRLKQNFPDAGVAEKSDGELLERFARGGDADAFGRILRRHGLMVWNTCVRVLGRAEDAEDAFQAVFLVLARDAKKIRTQASLGGWLHGVACRVARRIQRNEGVRRRHESRQLLSTTIKPPVEDELSWREMLALLDDELRRLPQRLHEPLVLCYLEGLTQDEAARRLRYSLSTFRRRLARAKTVLRSRLALRGCALSTALVTPLLADCAFPVQLPSNLFRTTIQSANAFVAGEAVPAPAVALMKGITPMTIGKISRVVALMLLLGGFLTVGAVGLFGASAAQSGLQNTEGTAVLGGGEPARTAPSNRVQPKVKDDFTWGMARDGLRIGIKIIDAEKARRDGNRQRKIPAYRAGDQLRFELCFQNVGHKLFKGRWEFNFSYHRSSPVIRDSRGRDIEIKTPNLPVVYFSTVFDRVLKPQEKICTGPIVVDIGTRTDRANFVMPAQPGQYTLSHRKVERDRDSGKELVGMYVKGGFAEYEMAVPELRFEILPALPRAAQPPPAKQANKKARTPIELVRAATARTGFPAEGYPVLPSLSTIMRGNVCNEIAKSAKVRSAYEQLDVAKHRNNDWFNGVAQLEKEKAVWCLQSCMCHASEDVQIRALQSLARLKDKRAVPFLLIYAEYMAIWESGSENATIHGVIHRSTAQALSAITGVEVKLKGQDPEGLLRGINRWRRWQVIQEY